MTRLWVLAATALLGMVVVGCDRSAEPDQLVLATDESREDFVPVDYELTSDTYRKWVVAQQNLSREAGDADLGLPAERILLTNPSAASIDTVVTYLEGSEPTRRAIESADLSVRDYVLATLALYQATDRPDTLGLAPGGRRLPIANVALATRYADEISTARASSRVRFVDDTPRRGKGKGGKGKGRGKGKGKN